MAEYVWHGSDRKLARKSGRVEAASRAAAVQMLRGRGIHVASLRERGREVAIPRVARVSARDLATFTRQLSVMVDAGLPIVECLGGLANLQGDRALGRALHRVRTDVESGSTLAESMERQPHAFGQLYTSMVAAGEAGGILDVVLKRLAIHIEKVVRLRRAVRSALVYPSVVVSIAVLVVTVILWKVIPTFEQLFAGLGAPLPLPTRITLAASRALGTYGPFLAAGLCVVFLGLRAAYGTRRGRYLLDGALLRIPITGELLRKVAVARFSRTLGTLVGSGVPLLDALEITARTAGNAVVEAAILTVRRCVEEGKTLAEPLAETGVFPGLVTQMVEVGERTGALETMLAKVADFFEEEVDAAVEDLMSLLEPVMIVFLGITIGGIVISMYLPIFQIVTFI